MTGFLRDLVRRLRRKPQVAAVRVSDEGLMLFDGDQLRNRCAWGDVVQIVTFKRDLGTFDEIRLAFRVDEDWVEVSEDAEGWSALLVAVNRHFPTVPPDWQESVMFPPFETRYRVLYDRP